MDLRPISLTLEKCFYPRPYALTSAWEGRDIGKDTEKSKFPKFPTTALGSSPGQMEGATSPLLSWLVHGAEPPVRMRSQIVFKDLATFPGKMPFLITFFIIISTESICTLLGLDHLSRNTARLPKT